LGESNQTIRTSENQLLCCKSIDKLIAEADNPEHRLKKSLGPWSLTALGIGAIIGSGIFVLTGTAAAGEHFEAPSILHAQVLDLFLNLVRTGSTSGANLHASHPVYRSPRRYLTAFSLSPVLVGLAFLLAGLYVATKWR
jgi:hypothetical protein